MTQKITIGIIGCGKIAHVDHVPHLLNVRGVAITDLYDISPEKMSVLDRTFSLGASHHASIDDLLAESPDAVVVCTPNSLHREQTLAALRAGCHVLCEKPMAASTPECTKMIDAALKAGRILHINHSLHYLPPYFALAYLVQSGAIGKVRHVRCLRFHDSTPDIGWSKGASWFVSKAFSGGIVLDIGVHMVDLMKWLAGPVSEINAITETRTRTLDVVDNVCALLRFESGATGILELSWTAPVECGLIEVYGDKGALRMGFAPDVHLEWLCPSGQEKTKMRYPKAPETLPTSQQAFVDAIVRGKPSPTPGELGRDAVALCEAILKSGERQRSVKVKQFV